MARYGTRTGGSSRKVQVTLPEEYFERLQGVAAALDVSMASIVRDLIGSSLPVLSVLEDAALAVKNAPERQSEAMEALADELAAHHGLNSERLAEVVALQRAMGDDPRASNTGVSTDG